MSETIKTMEDQCNEALKSEDWVGYFKKAKALVEDDFHDYELGTIQTRAMQLGIVIIENADAALSDTPNYVDYGEEPDEEEDPSKEEEALQKYDIRTAAIDAEFRGFVFDTLRAFVAKYPQDFASHLRRTYPTFPYPGLLDFSQSDVFDFWFHVANLYFFAKNRTPAGSYKEGHEIEWLAALAYDLTNGEGTPAEAFSYANAKLQLEN